MKLSRPVIRPIRKPKLQPGQRQRRWRRTTPRIRQITACPRTKPAIAASISRASRAHRVAMLQRHPAVDRRDHAVPVAQQIEGDHRRDDEQRQHREQRPAAGPQRRQERRRASPRPASPGRRPTCRHRAARSPNNLGEPRPARIGDQRLQPRQIARQIVDEGGELLRSGSAPTSMTDHDQRDDDQRHDDQRRHAAADAEALGRRATDRADRPAPCRPRTAAGRR